MAMGHTVDHLPDGRFDLWVMLGYDLHPHEREHDEHHHQLDEEREHVEVYDELDHDGRFERLPEDPLEVGRVGCRLGSTSDGC